MADSPDTSRRREPGRLLRLLHLAVLSAGAIAAPIYASVGDHAQFLAAFGARGRDTWAFLLVVLLLPPLLLWLPGLIASFLSRTAGYVLHLLAIALLGGLLGLLLAKGLTLGNALSILLAVVAAGGIAAAYALLPPVRMLATLAAPLPIAVLALFVFNSSAGSLARGAGNPAGADVNPKQHIPVVMVEFDEFPLYSLENARGSIDTQRYPNFGVLASNSTWYQHYTPVFDETTRLSASILTGNRWMNYARPWYKSYPNNLYKLLGRHYRIVASEEATDFCSPKLCARRLVLEDWKTRLRHLLHGAGHDYLRRVAPPEQEAKMTPIDPALRSVKPVRKNQRTQVLANLIGNGRITRWDKWVNAIGASKGPTLYFKHSLVPHTPWKYLPDGRAYRRDPRTEPIPGFGGDQGATDPWLMIQEEQRHLLQTRLADRMLGHLIQRLKQTGIYNRALIVVLADHGQAFFEPGANRHVADKRTWAQLATAPLFIKYPGQTKGVVSTKRVRTYDLVPTIADVLNVKIPWKVHGKSILDPHSGVNQKVVTISQRTGPPPIVRPISAWQKELDKQRAHQIRLFGTGTDARLYDIGPRKDLHGKRVSSLHVAPQGRYTTPLFDKTFYPNIDLRSSFLPTNVAGRIDGGSLPRGLPVAVAVNGVIGATGETVRLPHDPKAYYTMMVPPARFRQGRNTVEVYLVKGSTLVPIGGT